MIVTGDKGECLTLMLIALSSTNNIVSPAGCLVSDVVDSPAGFSTGLSACLSVSGVFTEEASMKLVGVIRELGVRGSWLRGRSKYELPSMVFGNGSRERLLSDL